MVGYCNADQHGNDYDIPNRSQTNRDAQLPTKQKVDSSESDLISSKRPPNILDSLSFNLPLSTKLTHYHHIINLQYIH